MQLLLKSLNSPLTSLFISSASPFVHNTPFPFSPFATCLLLGFSFLIIDDSWVLPTVGVFTFGGPNVEFNVWLVSMAVDDLDFSNKIPSLASHNINNEQMC